MVVPFFYLNFAASQTNNTLKTTQMKTILSLACALWLVAAPAYSQISPSQEEHSTFKAFNQLDMGVTLGTTGVGVELASPIGEYMQLRAGFSFMPHFHYPMHFHVQVGDDPATSESKFNSLASKLEEFTGYKAKNEVEVTGVPTYYNFNMLVDFYPFKRSKHWRLTAGFYLGPKKIAKAYNVTEAMTSLLAVNIYNSIYDKIENGEPIYENLHFPPEYEEKILSYGRMGIHIGDFVDRYAKEHAIDEGGFWLYDDDGNPVFQDKLDANGNKVHQPYMVVPDDDGMVKASMFVNRFKPYVGIGYDGRLDKKNDRLKIGFDCGVMFWGGVPQVITQAKMRDIDPYCDVEDRDILVDVDLTRDVENIRGKVGTYVDVAKKFKVFPVLNLRLAYTLF